MGEGELPASATDASRRLLGVASKLTALCPYELGQEIALTGSASRGWADEYSDIELSFWVGDLDWPSCEQWLRQIGAVSIHPYPDSKESWPRWIEFEFRGVPAEAGWNTFERCEADLDRALAGRPTNAELSEGFFAEALENCIALRDGPHIQAWRSRLGRYPDILREVLISEAASTWSRWPRWFDLTSGFAARPEPSDLLERYDRSIRAALRILFAVNRRWEPGLRKWTRRWAETLEVKPRRLADRIFEIYEKPLAPETWPALLSLISETLRLVPAEIDVSSARRMVEEAAASYAEA